jgi:uncharacterized protein YfiM (DUF2279 family)
MADWLSELASVELINSLMGADAGPTQGPTQRWHNLRHKSLPIYSARLLAGAWTALS